jgi:hypothetical protein
MRPSQDVVVLTYINFEDDHVRFDQAHSTTDGHLHTENTTTTGAGMQMKEDVQSQPQIESDVRMDMEMGDDSMEAGFGEEADADFKLAPEAMTVAACNSRGHATLAEAQSVAVACGCDPILAHFMDGSYMVMGCVPTLTTDAKGMQRMDHSGTNPFMDLSMLSMDPADAGLSGGDFH